ncbi:Bug family tripartite tricarboxylate transporter substrate binding protein [Cupriavidus oxalaticus]|jgi:tripartite-type tricarboxylate transporter receptor subunit TctC|uniref:Exported protein n=1 Tax=Cupriavidus oxalaticus TaxID=96344 RepID=A0A375FPN1_9BURK|nr:tripartite tricarboxylate transporter substrate-binding protein [Cupriavidus oxalaticus]QEZ42895.1 tripartite tricarboxylate transporter substrate binding protein [Cupriavidus oxalaticus]QRQ83505.1 tripartite tricarboxylate transporter substrate binding protein [Cupriavidus oxalaticus]QRQ92406.1 tripartite tricarboxylate transporter substrate binding protein [Cupriavidus oxalaticus]WQD87024.1 tripartite tricarboxylate transporter substrate-binding protein [Cupriavidus oxalaticus]SPC07599.1 
MLSILRIVAALAALVLSASAAAAQSVRLVVGYPAGGGVDAVARLIAKKLSESPDRSFLVDNRSGASGLIGAGHIAKSAPDGKQFLVASPAEIVVSQAAGQKLPYSPSRDLVPVILIGETPLAVVAHPSLGVSQLRQLLAANGTAKTEIAYGTPGSGSSMHFAGAMLGMAGKLPLVHVPYKGAAPALNDLLGGQVQLGVMGLPPVLQFHRNGKLKILAVTTRQRSPALPDVPTVGELIGSSDYRFSNWMGVFAPANTPAAEVARLNQRINQALQDKEVRQQLALSGVEPVGGTPERFAAFLKEEEKRYTAIAGMAGIRYGE